MRQALTTMALALLGGILLGIVLIVLGVSKLPLFIATEVAFVVLFSAFYWKPRFLYDALQVVKRSREVLLPSGTIVNKADIIPSLKNALLCDVCKRSYLVFSQHEFLGRIIINIACSGCYEEKSSVSKSKFRAWCEEFHPELVAKLGTEFPE